MLQSAVPWAAPAPSQLRRLARAGTSFIRPVPLGFSAAGSHDRITGLRPRFGPGLAEITITLTPSVGLGPEQVVGGHPAASLRA